MNRDSVIGMRGKVRKTHNVRSIEVTSNTGQDLHRNNSDGRSPVFGLSGITDIVSLLGTNPLPATFTPRPQRGASGQSFREDTDWKHRVEIEVTWPYNWKYKHAGFPTPMGGYITMDDLKKPPNSWIHTRKRWKFWEDEPLMRRGSYLVEMRFKLGTTEKLMIKNGWWAPVLPGTPEDSEVEEDEEDQEVSNSDDSQNGGEIDSNHSSDNAESFYESRAEPTIDPVGPIPSAESFA